MDPEGVMVVLLTLIFFVFISMMIRSKHQHELKKLDRIAQGNADRSMTTGELEDMIRDIVSDMTAPLKVQVDELSRQLGTSGGPELLESGERVDDVPSDEKTVGRRTRA